MTRECDTCLAAGDHVSATVVAEIEDEGNGWQFWHYCQDCAEALTISNGDEISLDDARADDCEIASTVRGDLKNDG